MIEHINEKLTLLQELRIGFVWGHMNDSYHHGCIVPVIMGITECRVIDQIYNMNISTTILHNGDFVIVKKDEIIQKIEVK